MAFYDITPARLAQAAIPADPTIDTIYTVASKNRTFVKDIDICNTTSATVNAFVYLVKSGDSPTTSNLLLSNVEIPGNGVLQWTGSQILHEGDTIQVKGSATGLTINISGGIAV